jgi:hypothetical protein
MMKNLILFTLTILVALPIKAQVNKTEVLQNLENKSVANELVTQTATLKSSSRLFKTKDDLTSVIMIIPSGSKVNVLNSDSVYLHVVYEENEGFILSRHAVIDKTPANTPQAIEQQQPDVQVQPGQKQVMSQFSYLENKYGTNIASKIVAGKIWKGMNAEMVTDSWGIPQKVNKVTSGSIRKEEWIFKNTWLYFENNNLTEWGPLNK